MHLVRLVSSLMIGLSLGSFVTTPAQAQSGLFDNLGLNITCDRGTIGRVTRTLVFSGTYPMPKKTTLAFPPSGSDHMLQTIETVIGLLDHFPNGWDSALMPHEGDIPETTLEAFLQNGARSRPLLLAKTSSHRLHSVAHPLLSAVTSSFLAAFSATEVASAGGNETRIGKQGKVMTAPSSNGKVWFSQIRHALVMRVTGMPVSAAVPEPTAFMMEWSCLLGHIALRYRP